MLRVLIVCAVVSIAGVSAAGNQRDGCPNGRDVSFTKYGRYGAFAGTESIVQTNRASYTIGGTYISAAASGDRATHRYVLNRFDGVVNANVKGHNIIGTVALIGVSDATAAAGQPGAYGVVSLGLGYLRRFRTAIYANPDAAPEKLFSADEKDALAGVRYARGWLATINLRRNSDRRGSVELGMMPSLGFSEHEAEKDYQIDGFGARMEYRTEIVGCFAPFLHIEFAPRWSRPLDEANAMSQGFDVDPYGHVVAVPTSLSAGIQASDWFSFYAQYRLDAFAAGLRESDEISFQIKHRLRLGIEAAPGAFVRVNLAVDLAPASGIGGLLTFTLNLDEAYR